MEPISRRRALQLGGLGLTATVAGGVGLAWQAGRDTGLTTTTNTAWSEPTTLASTGRELSLTLDATEGRFPLAGGQVHGLGFNGAVPGPTLRVRPGDRIRLTLRNRLSQPTNLHLHGMYISPTGNGDNPFLRIEPGTDFDYEYRLPDSHPPGVYWYHPHHHGLVADQIFAGLYGAIVVEDTDPVPLTRERVLVIADLTIDGTGSVASASMMDRMLGREGNLVLVNGQDRPTITAGPGARERWRIVNACVSRYLRLRVDGQQLQLLGIDSGRFSRPRPVEEVVLAPGNRADLLVSTVAGSTQLRALPVDRGGMGMMDDGDMGMPGMGGGRASRDPAGSVLADVEVTGPPAAQLAPVPQQRVPRDLRHETVAATRTFTFAMGMGMGMDGMGFTIDGRAFDPNRTDQTVRIGTVEEWTLVNDSPMDHPMHLHVWPMQLLGATGSAAADPIWQDVINIPARNRVTVRVAFDDFPGRTVYHCHILDHEDAGMMGVIDAR